jgi:hypothetical protein
LDLSCVYRKAGGDSSVRDLKWFRVLAVALASVLIFAACSDDGGGGEEGTEEEASQEVPVDDYVADLCNALINWRDSVAETEAQFQQENALAGELPPEEAKDKLGTYLEELQGLTDDFVGDLQAAGTPDVEGGEDVAGEFVSGFEQFSQALGELQGQVEELPSDSQEAFQTAGTEFLTEIQTSLQGSLENLNQIDSQAIDQAFTDSEECSQVQPAS